MGVLSDQIIGVEVIRSVSNNNNGKKLTSIPGIYNISDFVNAPKYIFVTTGDYSKERWFKVHDSRAIEYSGVGEFGLMENKTYYSTKSDMIGHRYKEKHQYSVLSHRINTNDWKVVDDRNNRNAYDTNNNAGTNKLDFVKAIEAPLGYKNASPNYIWEDVSGDDLVWKLFEKYETDYNNWKNSQTENCKTAAQRGSSACNICEGAEYNARNASAKANCNHGLANWCNHDARFTHNARCMELASNRSNANLNAKIAARKWCDRDEHGNFKTPSDKVDVQKAHCQQDEYCCDSANNNANIYKAGCDYKARKFTKQGYLRYAYFNNTATDKTLIRTDYKYGLLDENNSNPINSAGVAIADHYMTVISGEINVPKTDNYTFRHYVDDTIEFWINNVKLFERKSGCCSWIESGPHNITIGAKPIKIISTEGGGGQRIKIEYKSSSGVGGWMKMPASWFSTEFPVNLIESKKDSVTNYCNIGTNWKNNDCIELLEKDTTDRILTEYKDKIIDDCKGKTAAQITAANHCNKLYNATSRNTDIKKSFCRVNGNFRTNAACNTILNKGELLPLYDAYCIPDGSYNTNSNYDQCNTFYKSLLPTGPNYPKYKNAINAHCGQGDKVFTTECNSRTEDEHTPTIIATKNTHCATPANLNSANCRTYIKQGTNMSLFNNALVQKCENDEGQASTDEICNYIYSNATAQQDPVLKQSKDRIDVINCKKDNKFVDDAACIAIADKEENKGSFIDPYIEYCKTGANIVNDKCTAFYNSTLNTIKQDCPESFVGGKESFGNCGCCDSCIGSGCGCCDSCGETSNTILYFFLLLIFILICVYMGKSLCKNTMIILPLPSKDTNITKTQT